MRRRISEILQNALIKTKCFENDYTDVGNTSSDRLLTVVHGAHRIVEIFLVVCRYQLKLFIAHFRPLFSATFSYFYYVCIFIFYFHSHTVEPPSAGTLTHVKARVFKYIGLDI